jgi:hypothetical protein
MPFGFWCHWWCHFADFAANGAPARDPLRNRARETQARSLGLGLPSSSLAEFPRELIGTHNEPGQVGLAQQLADDATTAECNWSVQSIA